MTMHQATASSILETMRAAGAGDVSYRVVGRVPLLVAAAVICLISAFNLVRLVTAPAPRNPGKRPRSRSLGAACGECRYTSSRPDGHATHVYGALVPLLQGRDLSLGRSQQCLGPPPVARLRARGGRLDSGYDGPESA